MTANGFVQIALYLAVLLAWVKPLGWYMARVYQGEPILLDRLLRPVERFIYRLGGVKENDEMDWKTYATALLIFSAVDLALLYALLRLQGALPLNPQKLPAVAPDLAFNIAVSFVTNTNWQNYAGETTLSYLSQMLGLTVRNFLSAAGGMAVLVALVRGLTRKSASTLGNLWVDVTRSVLYILLPLSIAVALVLVAQGTVQTLSGYPSVRLLQPTTDANGQLVTGQVLAIGPVASQVAIKHLGTNGGGFFGANAAHPFESPTPLTDFLLVLAETAIPASLTYTFGKLVGDTRQGWAILSAMLVILIALMLGAYAAEASGNPRLAALGVDMVAGDTNPGGNMEGKEVRLGVVRSAMFATATTATSSGAVDSMHDSFTPLGGLAPLLMMQAGEVILGGVGSGLYGMLVFVIVAVFIAGLMVGRTPEYLGKKIQAFEIKMASLVILVMPLIVLTLTALAVVTDAGKAGISSANPGPHGFSEILYAYTSQGNNNGSAFAGLSGNTLFHNLTGAAAMFLGRFFIAVPTLALAGSLARKKLVPVSAGTLPTHTPLFVVLLVGVVVIVAALTFIPADALGPVVEQLMLTSR